MIDVRKTWARFGWKPSEPKKPEVVSTRDLDEIPPSAEIIVWFNGHEQVPEDEREVLLHLRYDGGDADLMIGYYDSGLSLTLNDGDSFTLDFSATNGVIQIS